MLWVGRFGISNGEAREETPWLGIYQDPKPGDESSDVYALVYPALPGSEEFCGEMKDAIGEAYHRQKASLTGGLLRALQTAHENLRDWNRRSLKDHRVAAGVSCVAARGNLAHLAQVGPAAAAFYHRGEVHMLRPRLPGAVEALGLEDEFWPEFWRFEMEDGDRLLLLSPDLAQSLPAEELAPLLALSGEEALPHLYEKAAGLTDCGALLVAALPDHVAA